MRQQARLLQEAPQIKLLVTSRHRLNLREEWVFDLAGLAYPPDDSGESEATEPVAYSALPLRLHHAQRVRHDFVPTAADRKATANLCRLREGLPLGLELALALTYWGEPDRPEGDLAAAHARQAESLALFRELGEEQGLATSNNNLGVLASLSGDYMRRPGCTKSGRRLPQRPGR